MACGRLASLRLSLAVRAGARARDAQAIDDRGKIGRQRRAGAERAALRPFKTDAMGVQEHARKAERAKLRIEVRIPVLLVSRDRMPSVCGVHANLMRASGKQAHLHERCE